MESFAWDTCFDTGIALVDQQHHRLFDLINRFGTVTVGVASAPPSPGAAGSSPHAATTPTEAIVLIKAKSAV